MSSRSAKNTQLLVLGLVAAATVGYLVYFSSATATAKSKKDEDYGDDGDGGDTKKSTPLLSPSTNTSDVQRAALDGTPKKSNVSDQKELHSKIEELDKKGKALFKSKKVGFFIRVTYGVSRTAMIRSGWVAFFVFKMYFISQSSCIYRRVDFFTLLSHIDER